MPAPSASLSSRLRHLAHDACEQATYCQAMAMLTFEHLRVFLAVAEQHSFTKAAEMLYLTQPSVSQHIQALEQYYGKPS